MKKVSNMRCIVLGCLALAVNGVSAEEGNHAQKKLERMTEHLGLSSEQQAKIKPLLEAHEQESQKEHAELKNQLATIFSAEQLAKFEEKREHKEDKGCKHKEN
jgi:hypothetical protein